MAGKVMCSSCFDETGYTCLRCSYPFCNKCSVFENDEDVPGWTMGKSVAYCIKCDEDIKQRKNPTSNLKRKQNETENDTNRKRIQPIPEAMQEEQDDCEYDEDANVSREKGKEKKKPGRKTPWSSTAINDLIDIVLNNNVFKRKLIFVNTKNQKNGEIYNNILQELKNRASSRGETISFTISQLRNKFKKCVSECKKAAMTIKTSTGIKRFQEERGFGEWFDHLFPVVKTRDSCQPEQAVEPSSSEGAGVANADGQDTSTSGEQFVPVKSSRKKPNMKENINSTTLEVLHLVKDIVKNDPTKGMIEFMREEMDKCRQQELQLFQLMLNSNSNVAYNNSYQQSMPVSHGAHHEGVVQFPNGPFMEQGFHNNCHTGFATNTPNQSNITGLSTGMPFRSPHTPIPGLGPYRYTPSPSTSSTSDENLSTYQTL